MSTEYGVFNAEGCVESGFYTYESAAVAAGDYDEDDESVTVEPVCPDHEEQPRDDCEECYAEDESDDES